MEEHARALVAGIDAALPAWVVRSVEARLVAYRGSADPATMAAARRAAEEARAEVVGRVSTLVLDDVDAQRTTPLAILREAVRYPAAVLAEAGVPPVARDDFSLTRFPDDHYDLTPATLADIDPDLVELGVAWGAAKAWVHRQRHGGPARPPAGGAGER